MATKNFLQRYICIYSYYYGYMEIPRSKTMSVAVKVFSLSLSRLRKYYQILLTIIFSFVTTSFLAVQNITDSFTTKRPFSPCCLT